jgi:hypothetical protein
MTLILFHDVIQISIELDPTKSVLACKPHFIYNRKTYYSVPLFEKEGLGEILLDKSPSIPLFQRGR